jgi:F-type H+-transporting ATPase subunit delta
LDDRIVGYANGILELARAEGDVERVENELFEIAQALDKSAELRSSLTDPQLPIERKQAVIEDLLGGRATPLTVGLIQLIISQGRISELPEMARAVAERAAETRSKVLAEVRSAIPLDDDTIQRLAVALSKATGKNVEVKVVVDESVIGGIVARIGDTVIDGSIARRVDSLRQALNTR